MPLSLWAQDCEDNLDVRFQDLFDIKDYDACSREKDKCSCIQKAIADVKQGNDSYSNTNLQKKIDDAYNLIQTAIKKGKEPYYKNFSSVYKKMTVNLAAQKMVLGIDSTPQGVGCTAQDMSKGIRKKTEKSLDKQIDALKILKQNAASKSGKKNGALQVNKVALLSKKIETLTNLKNSKSNEYCLMALGALPEDETKKQAIGNKKDCASILQSYSTILEGGVATGENPISDCEDINDPLCQAFALKNTKLNNEEEGLFKEKNNKCLTYAEYMSFKGMPSPGLLDLFSTMDNPEKLIDPSYSGFLSRGNDIEKSNFLHANPLIAQLATSENKYVSEELGKRLKAMAKEVRKNKGNIAEQFNSYMKFMKGSDGDNTSLKELYVKYGADSSRVACDHLQSSFTAISISNDEKKLRFNDINKEENDVFSCIAKIYENTNSSELDKTLLDSKLYQLASKEVNDELSEKAYNKFADDECGNIVKIKDIKDGMAKSNTASNYTKSDLKKMTSWSNESLQNHEYKAEYYREVTSKMNQDSLATVFDKGEFRESQRQNAAISSSQNVGEKFSARQQLDPNQSFNPSEVAQAPSPSNPSESGFSRSSDDKNQVRPEFTANQSLAAPTSVPNYSSIPKETFEQSKEITDLDPAFDKKTDEQKLSTYKALEEFKEESGTSPDFKTTQAIKDLENKIATKTKEITEADKNKVEVNKTAQSNGQVGNFRNLASVINPPISNAPMLSQFPRASPISSTEKNKAKAQASYEAALLNMGTGQIVIQANNAEAPFVIAEIITADDSEGVYPFKNLKNPDVLSEFLALKVGDKIKTGESIKIKDPNSNDYFVIKATKKDGVTAYQLIPFVKKEVIRISTRAQLKHALNPKY